MRRNRKSSTKKERIIMIASSAFVLAALTMTGVYIKDRENQVKDDGYSIDFDALENNVDQKYQEITQNDQAKADLQGDLSDNAIVQNPVTEDDLDYLPMEEAGSNLVEIPGLTDQNNKGEDSKEGHMGGAAPDAEGESDQELKDQSNQAEPNNEESQKEDKTAGSDQVTVSKELHFSEDLGLIRPSAGEIIMHYSMESSIYFATLDQYKYNPAVMFGAAEGDAVNVCADGKVISVFQNEEIGNAVLIDLGDGYQATYGQLGEIKVNEGSYVNRGEQLGVVAAPTKYYSVEGTNLYFSLTKDGTAVNPENLFQ